MEGKTQILKALEREFKQWDELLARLSEEEAVAAGLPSGWSIKDIVGHLRGWQQVSIARLEAALHGREPEFPDWLAGSHPEEEVLLERYNRRIYDEYREQDWASVQRAWREGFLRLLELARRVPEDDLLAKGKYPWLGEYPLSAVLHGSREHHQEHREWLPF
jgi:hypothetical protein